VSEDRPDILQVLVALGAEAEGLPSPHSGGWRPCICPFHGDTRMTMSRQAFYVEIEAEGRPDNLAAYIEAVLTPKKVPRAITAVVSVQWLGDVTSGNATPNEPH
jgi:hypothetical protein